MKFLVLLKQLGQLIVLYTPALSMHTQWLSPYHLFITTSWYSVYILFGCHGWYFFKRWHLLTCIWAKNYQFWLSKKWAQLIYPQKVSTYLMLIFLKSTKDGFLSISIWERHQVCFSHSFGYYHYGSLVLHQEYWL